MCIFSANFFVMRFTKNSKSIFICLERRVVFCLGDKEPSSPQYQHFMECLQTFKLSCSHLSFVQDVEVISHSVDSIASFFEAVTRPGTMELIEIQLTYGES